MNYTARIASLAVALLLAAPAWASHSPLHAADEFDRAIADGDPAKIKAMLAPDVLIYEFGGQESSFEEYAASHMKADIEFMAKVKGSVVERRHGANGSMAWVATRRRLIGTYKDKPIDVFSTETLVMQRESAGWRIVHIQWSSQPAQPPKK